MEGMEEILYKLIDRIEKVAPQVWEMAIRQVYVEGITSLVSVIACLVLARIGYKAFRWGYENIAEPDYGWDNPLHLFAVIIGSVICVFTPVLAYIELVSAIKSFVNPQFAAIKILPQLGGVQ